MSQGYCVIVAPSWKSTHAEKEAPYVMAGFMAKLSGLDPDETLETVRWGAVPRHQRTTKSSHATDIHTPTEEEDPVNS